MSDLEYVGKVKMTRLTSLDEDFKESQRQFRKDEEARLLRRNGISKPTPETVYERFDETYDASKKQTLQDLIALKKIIPASLLKAEQEAQEIARAKFESAVMDEESHRRTKKPNGVGLVKPIFKRERFDE